MPIPFFATMPGIKPSSFQEKPLGPSSAHRAMPTVALGQQAQRLLVILVGKDSSGVHPPKPKGSQQPRAELQAGGRVAWEVLGRKGFGSAG